MKVELHAADAGGCGHYRLVWPGQAVQEAGLAEVRILVPGTDDAPSLPTWWLDGKVVGLREREWPDVLVLQRPLRWELVEAARKLREAGVSVVVELDDDFAAIPPTSVAAKMSQPHKVAALLTACAEADLVTVSTPALAERYAPHGRVAVLPNYLPAALAAYTPGGYVPGCGWSGSVGTHADDLKAVGNGLARAMREAGRPPLNVVGTGVGVAAGLGYPVTNASGWKDLVDGSYWEALKTLGVGIAPLAMNAFNQAKSWLKPLEYAAVGVPSVVSPSPEYKRLAETVPGVFVAADQNEWRYHLRKLLTDRDAWAEAALAAYLGVRSTHLLSTHAAEWVTAWETARAYHLSGRLS